MFLNTLPSVRFLSMNICLPVVYFAVHSLCRIILYSTTVIGSRVKNIYDSFLLLSHNKTGSLKIQTFQTACSIYNTILLYWCPSQFINTIYIIGCCDQTKTYIFFNHTL